MKTHIKLSEPIYKIDEEAGEISCYIAAQAKLEIFNYIFFDNIPMYKKLMNKFQLGGYDEIKSFTGIARLKEDKWNETLGKRIAESKCKRSIYGFYSKVFDFIGNEIDKELTVLDQTWSTLLAAKNTEEKHFEQLTGVKINEDKH